MKPGWYRTEGGIVYWFDGTTLWCPNEGPSIGTIAWMEPGRIFYQRVSPCSRLEVLVITGQHLRSPALGDWFRYYTERIGRCLDQYPIHNCTS